MVTIDEKVLQKLNPADRLERIAELKEELEAEKTKLSRLEEQSQIDLRDRIAQDTELPAAEPLDISKLFESEEPKKAEQPVQIITEEYRNRIKYEGGSVAAPEIKPEIVERHYTSFVDPLQTQVKKERR